MVAPAHLDIREGEQTVLKDFGCTQLVASVNDVYLVAEAGKEDCVLDGNVSASDYRNVLTAEKCTVACCAVGNTHSGKFELSRDTEFSMFRAGSKNDGFSFIFIIHGHDFFDVAGQVHGGDGFCDKNSAETFCVFAHFHGQVHSVDSRSCRIVVNFVCVDDLAAAHKVLFNDDEIELGPGGIDSGGETGRAGADDN